MNSHLKQLSVELLFIDLETCGRCLGTEAALDAAVTATRPALGALGIGLELTKTLVESTAHAVELEFRSTPTIRIDGRDIAGALRESNCGDCGEVCGGEDTDCRVWRWGGKDHTAAPVGLLVEAILQAAVSPARDAEPRAVYVVPENIEQFFATKQRRVTSAQSCEAPAFPPCCGPADPVKPGCGY